MGSSAAKTVERAVAENGGRYCDDPVGVLVSSHREAIELLRWQEPDANRFAARFRTDDFPSATVVWQQVAPTSALVHQLVNGRAGIVHLLLGGQHMDDEMAIHMARRMFGDRFPESGIDAGSFAEGVQWVALLLRDRVEGDDELSGALGFLAIVPIFCRLCGID